jgi:hypothetical protein
MSLYAWKISASDKPDIEGVSTLDGLQAFISTFDLPLTRSPKDIVTQTRLMEREGQGVYKHRTDSEQWTLLWVALH